MEGLDDTEGKSEGERTTKDTKDTKGKWSQTLCRGVVQNVSR